MDKVEFEFPDEKEAKEKESKKEEVVTASEETEIEIVDDTPEEEKRHKKMEDPPKEVDDDELSSYGERVRKRIQHLHKGYQEEKRRAEAAFREKEEVLRFAQTVVDENKKLKGSVNQSQTALLEQAKKVVATELDTARRQYKDAYESGDADALLKANEALTAAKMRAEKVNNFKPALQPEENPVKQETKPDKAPPPDEKAVRWASQNPWFGPDDEMTSFAYGYHAKLLKSGVDPSSDEYYDKLNNRMRQVFPDYFESEKSIDDEEIETSEKPPKSNVAPATRSSAPKKVNLTQRQVQIAKRLGVPLELYARKVAEQLREQK
jgi:hypothetical protein